MVCVSEETVVCCVYNDLSNVLPSEEHMCTNPKNSAKITVRVNDSVEILIQEICKSFDLEENTFELCMQRRNGTDIVLVPLSDSKKKLLTEVGVTFAKNCYNSFIIREIDSSDDCNGLYGTNNGTENVAYRDNDDLLLGASASPTSIEGSNNITQGSTEDPLLISVLMRQDSIPYVGLVNQAMTCYLNSLLQALYMTPEFRNALYNWVFDGYDAAKSIPYQLQKLFLNLQTSTKSAVETTELTHSFGWDLSEAWQQHDVQELCRVMFDALEQKFKDTDQADLINRLYQGRMIDYVKCLECHTEKSRVDTFLDIPLLVRSFGSTISYGSVEEALFAFVQPEILEGNNQYFCDKCKKKCDAHKGFKFSTIPYLLTLHLMRFDFDYSTMHRIKLNDKVVFPESLDLNSFITSSTFEEIPEAISEETTGVKCDDSSTADSGSALDDEGCQTSDGTSTSTTASTAPTTNNSSCTSGGAPFDELEVDMNLGGVDANHQEDDEGIDVSSGASNMHENEKNRRHNAKSGPYIYELFSILIHSGSAAGGHYYAYIKDLRKGKWFCYDDQTVSRITYDDIRKTYGGGPSRSYYSGAYSSSTNAYMLMYRQIDTQRNVQAMTVEEFPPHIKKLLQTLRERDEYDRLNREREMVMCKLKLYINHPIQNQIIETKLFLHNDTTMTEATQEAYRKSKLDGIVPIEQCRFVSYNRLQDSIECSFEGRDDEPISDILSSLKCPVKTDWLLEIRHKDAEFMEYKPGGVNIKVYAINIENEDVSGPITVRGYETQTCREFKNLLAKTLNLNENTMKIAVESYNNGGVEPNLLENDDDEIISKASICNAYKVYVANALDEDPDKPFIISKFHKIIDKFEHIISLDVILPINDKSTLDVLSIPPLDLNQNCEKLESGAGEPAVLAGISVSPKLPSVSPVQGTPTTVPSASTMPIVSSMQQMPVIAQPPPPMPEVEDTVAPGGGHSDQSNSEDSSLSDSDRTLVGDAPDECLAQLSSTSNSPAASEQHLSSPEDPHNIFLEENWTEEVEPPTRRCPNYFFKATEVSSEPSDHVGKTLKVLVDKRTNLVKLKKELEPYVGVPMEYFKIYRQYSSQDIECTRLTETLGMSRDGEKLIVKLGRVLKDNEHAGKVYQLIPHAAEPIRFLCDWVVAKGMTVAQAKREILEAIKKQYQIDIPFNRCRLRKKNWKNPNVVYRDDQKFIDDILLHTNWEMFVQELTGPEVVMNSDQLLLFVRQWCPSTLELKPYQEVLLDGTSVAEFKDKLSTLSKIPVENVEFTILKGTFPHEMSVLGVQTDLEWNSTASMLNDYPFSVYEDGHAFLFRDNRESLKQLTAEERKEICNKETNRTGRFSKSNLYSPRKERALKIYLDTSSKKCDDAEVD